MSTSHQTCVRCGSTFTGLGALNCRVHIDTFCSSTNKWLCCGKKARLGEEQSMSGCLAVEHTTDEMCIHFEQNTKLLFRKQVLNDQLVDYVNTHGKITPKQLYLHFSILDDSRCYLIQRPQDETEVHCWQIWAPVPPIHVSAKDALGETACCVQQTRRSVQDTLLPPTTMVSGQSKRRKLSAPYLLVCKCDVKARSRSAAKDTE